ncbi:MAG: alkane 1-monooxygenase [Minwuia sp.]|uniref:alkane 1-monooxygenase n=1 Tax=Minwuia sp. TaxID=2493630 RepID=UPI003A85F7CB
MAGKVTTFDHDPRRPYWPIGFMAPAVAPLLLGMHLLGANQWIVAALPIVLLFGIAPFADHLIGRDYRNVTRETARKLAADPYYRRLMRATVPAYAVGILAAAVLVSMAPFTVLQWLVFTVGIAFVHSLMVLVAHELGHARSARDRSIARFALSLIAYGHFGVEHNVNHHLKVATPDDPASARYNESIYRFALREMPGVFLGAVECERKRLARRGKGFWTIENELVGNWAMSLLIAGLLTILLGPAVLAFFALHSLVTWFSITMANYTAHYGLLRRMVDGRREPCRPEHSWSSGFLFSNLLFLNLQRHSDHHANAQRPYQVLSYLPGTPELPAGIPGLFCMMLVPPLWFRVMNPRLLDAVGHDPSRINFSSAADARRMGAPSFSLPGRPASGSEA